MLLKKLTYALAAFVLIKLHARKIKSTCTLWGSRAPKKAVSSFELTAFFVIYVAIRLIGQKVCVKTLITLVNI